MDQTWALHHFASSTLICVKRNIYTKYIIIIWLCLHILVDQVDLEKLTCTCPDFIYRCKDKNILCKHLIKAQKSLDDYEKNFYMEE